MKDVKKLSSKKAIDKYICKAINDFHLFKIDEYLADFRVHDGCSQKRFPDYGYELPITPNLYEVPTVEKLCIELNNFIFNSYNGCHNAEYTILVGRMHKGEFVNSGFRKYGNPYGNGHFEPKTLKEYFIESVSKKVRFAKTENSWAVRLHDAIQEIVDYRIKTDSNTESVEDLRRINYYVKLVNYNDEYGFMAFSKKLFENLHMFSMFEHVLKP